jgi:dTMP kinase
MFFSFDGIDGVGKSTQLVLFARWLEDEGRSVVTCRDPGSTPLGERIRSLLLAHDDEPPIHRRAEMLLYMAARAQLVEAVIRPALEAGKIVVSDRFLLANIVYQAYAGGLPLESVRQVGEITVAGVVPDAVFLLDMDPSKADARLNRPLDRMERQGAEFRERLRAGFLAEAHRSPQTIHVLDANCPVEELQSRIRAIATRLMQ